VPLPSTWNLPLELRERLGAEAGPQRAMREEGHLLIVLHELPGPNERKRKAALFWRHPTGQWKSTHDDAGLEGLQHLLAQYDERLQTLDEGEASATSAAEFHAVLESLTPLLRAARGMHRAMQQARDLIKSDRDLLNLRDKAAEIERTAELLMQDAQFGLNFTAAKQAESQAQSAQSMARTAHRINLLAAMFLPLTALASVFGMEIHNGFENSNAAFPLIVIIGCVAGVVLSVVLAKRCS